MSSDGLPFARSFRELIVYQKQRQFSREVFALTKEFSLDQQFSLTDQLRRAALFIGARIAESWAERPNERYFVSKLTDADAEQMETQHWLETARHDGYSAPSDCARLLGLCAEIGGMLGSMIEKASAFCSSPNLRENITVNCLSVADLNHRTSLLTPEYRSLTTDY